MIRPALVYDLSTEILELLAFVITYKYFKALASESAVLAGFLYSLFAAE